VLAALVFDFDGLIVDSEIPVYRAWAELYGEHGEELELEFWKGIIGHGSNYHDTHAELERRLGRRLDRDRIAEARRLRVEELMTQMPVLEGVLEWRSEARSRGLRLGLASSSTRLWVTTNLRRLGLEEGWDCVRCRDDVGRGKPDPAVYLAVAAGLGIEPARGLALEDSESGVAAAKAAGFRCLAVPSSLTREHDLSAADLRLDSLAERSLGEVLELLEP